MLEDLAGIPVDVEYASEYTYRSTHTLHNPGVLVISQSGETADTLAALREAQARGLATVAITNNAHSSMAIEASASLPTFAGIEKAIPATKSFTTQLAVLYSLALHLARFRGRMTQQAAEAHGRQLQEIPPLIQAALARLAKTDRGACTRNSQTPARCSILAVVPTMRSPGKALSSSRNPHISTLKDIPPAN